MNSPGPDSPPSICRGGSPASADQQTRCTWYTDRMDPVIFVSLLVPPVVPLAGFDKHTSLLASGHRFKTHVVLGFCAPEMSKAPSVSGIFNEVQPLNGEWTLEVAVELPDLLPSIDGKSEAVVSTVDTKGVQWQLCLSNRISRFHYQDGPVAYHAIAPRTEPWHGVAEIVGEGNAKLIAAEEQLRTVAAMSFQVKGNTAEHAFESSIKACLETLFASVNTVLHATRECRVGFTPTTRSLRWDGVASVYVLMSGDGKPKGARLALNGARIALNPESFEGDKAAQFRSISNGTLPLGDVDRLIGEARSSWEDGEYEFAFLQAVISAEIATARAVRAESLRRGVSKTKLDDNRKEMTYSWALNIGLPLCFPSATRPKDTLIAAMNSARSKRNDLMHEAKFDMTRDQIGQLLTDTREYVNALKAAEAASAAALGPIK